jgi:hypothetical protein
LLLLIEMPSTFLPYDMRLLTDAAEMGKNTTLLPEWVDNTTADFGVPLHLTTSAFLQSLVACNFACRILIAVDKSTTAIIWDAFIISK